VAALVAEAVSASRAEMKAMGFMANTLCHCIRKVLESIEIEVTDWMMQSALDSYTSS
jgi:hypothetical protein